MSVQSQIERIKENVANTYSALSEMGATIPDQQNSNNIAATVLTVPRGGSSSSTDWKDITNKPFVIEGSPDTLTWDGNTEGLVSLPMEGLGCLYKVSDTVPEENDLAAGASMTWGYDTNLNTMDCSFDKTMDGMFMGPDGFVVIVAENGVNVDLGGVSFSEAGTYFMLLENGIRIFSLTIPGYTGFGKEKIDPSYLYQPDWNQTDETAADFIKNKPFGTDYVMRDIIPETTVIADEDGNMSLPAEYGIQENNEYVVTWNGDVYNCIGQYTDVLGIPAIAVGNFGIIGGNDTGEPFLIAYAELMAMYAIIAADGLAEVTVSIHGNVQIDKKIDAKYLDTIVTFYSIGTDYYLYWDIHGSSKVTLEELRRATANKHVVIVDSGTDTIHYPLSITGVASGALGYGIVIFRERIGNFLEFYTAEYTP